MPPYRRPVNMMFQSYALFPHMTVAGNVAFGLKQDGLPKDEIAARVDEMLGLVQLRPLASRKPDQLSGGQRQRVALARSLAKHPKVLLLDEPLAALDRKLREETRFELKELQRRLETTFVIVTHDQDEAMTVADRIAVMNRGQLAQVGAPIEVYERPNSRWVAGFLGDVNLIEGHAISVYPSFVMVEGEGLRLRVAHAPVAPGPVAVALRPEKIRIGHEIPQDAVENGAAGARHRHRLSRHGLALQGEARQRPRAQGRRDERAAPVGAHHPCERPRLAVVDARRGRAVERLTCRTRNNATG